MVDLIYPPVYRTTGRWVTWRWLVTSTAGYTTSGSRPTSSWTSTSGQPGAGGPRRWRYPSGPPSQAASRSVHEQEWGQGQGHTRGNAMASMQGRWWGCKGAKVGG